MMKLAKRAAALVLAAVLALSLTACSPKEVASNLILKTADLLGLREEGSDDDEADEIVAQPGGEVNFPDGLQDTSVHWNQQVQDGTLYVAFNSIQNRNTEYFVAGSDTVQVTGYGTTESTGILEFKVALWELSEDKTTTSYVAGTTVYFPTGGECSTYTISGLTPGRLYKANVSYDSGMFIGHITVHCFYPFLCSISSSSSHAASSTQAEAHRLWLNQLLNGLPSLKRSTSSPSLGHQRSDKMP